MHNGVSYKPIYPSFNCSINLAADHNLFDVPKRHDLLKVVVSKYCVQKLSNVNGDNLDELDPHLAKHH